MNLFIASVQRDLLVYFRHPSEVLNPLIFFVVVISLFPLGIGPEPGQLKEIAPGIVWVAALLATLMSMDSMFRSDFEDGSLEQVVLSEQSTFIFVLAKVASHWLLSGLPLVLLMPLAALLLFLDEAGIWALTLSLLLVSPTLSLLGGIGAALTVGLPRGGLLVTILVMPLYVPVLVLATAMVQAAEAGSETIGYIYWLLAILFGAVCLAPIATAAAVNVATDQ